jgi:putative FmdB family regulatory protein
MPIYAYKCATCGHAKDVLQKISDPLLTVCPECGAETFSKQVTAAGFQLKGSGWYVTDFRDNGGAKAAAAKSDAKGDGNTEAKTADSGSAKSGDTAAPSAGAASASPPSTASATPASTATGAASSGTSAPASS